MSKDNTELRKALVSTDVADLIPEDLSAVLHEELLDVQPLLRLLAVEEADGKTHEFNKKTSHPAGWFEGEVTPANPRKGTYGRDSVSLKIVRNWGSVSGFSQAVTRKFINMLAEEIDGSIQGVADVIEYSTLFGTAGDTDTFTGDAYQYSGILPYLYEEAIDNVINGGGDKITLDDLDLAISKVNRYRQAKNDPKIWFATLRMRQVLDGLQTKVQMALQSMEMFDGKLNMRSYDGIPFLETPAVGAGDSGVTSLAAADGAASSTGSLAAVTYAYRIASVTLGGEQVAVVEDTQSPASDGNQIDLTWTADANAKLYMIFRKADAGDEELRDIIPALTYDSEGTVNGTVESWDDLSFAAASVKAIAPLETGEQIIVILNTNKNNSTSFLGYVDDMGEQVETLVSFVPLARVKDTYDFMLKGYMAMKFVNPELSAVIRNVKLA